MTGCAEDIVVVLGILQVSDSLTAELEIVPLQRVKSATGVAASLSQGGFHAVCRNLAVQSTVTASIDV